LTACPKHAKPNVKLKCFNPFTLKYIIDIKSLKQNERLFVNKRFETSTNYTYMCKNVFFHLLFIDSQILCSLRGNNSYKQGLGLGWSMPLSTIFQWRPVLLVEETIVPGENQRPVASH
jgi:hypothetical protein